jgi:hypothetical protein
MMMTGLSKRQKSWWQDAAPADFRNRISTLNAYSLKTLGAEIRGALAFLQGQLDSADAEKRATDWWRRANLARGFIAEKQAFVQAELARRDEQEEGVLRMKTTARLSRLLVSLDDARDARDVQHVVHDLLVLLQDYFNAADCAAAKPDAPRTAP